MSKQDIRQLEPKALWQNFYDMTQIPRPSGKRKEIGDFLMNFGKSLGLETLQDEEGNVLVRKPATPGMENRKSIILQAHMDMVPQKNRGVDHDFEKDPIETIIEGDWVRANETTLGADNGIGVAAAMAVLQATDLKHPMVEMFITVDEENGMHGAFGLQPNFLEGEILMNLDSEEEGELCVGCAGGLDANITFSYEEVAPTDDEVAYRVSLTGLKGGHSGIDIDLQRANANKLMFRFLKEAVAEDEVRLSSIEGGSLRNAIPREAFAVVTVPKGGEDDFLATVAEFEALYTTEFDGVEDVVSLKAEPVDMPKGLMPEEVQDDLINAVVACPNGAARFLPDAPDVVETSNNLAMIQSDGKNIEVKCLLRSSADSRKEELASEIESVFSLAGAKVEFAGGYPGWQPNLKSPILKEMKSIYERDFGTTPEVMIIHAGLECGILSTHYPHLDMISFGPTIQFPHSPDERVNVPSVQKFWDYLVTSLEEAPLKA